MILANVLSRKNEKGMTLVEVTVYLALFAVVFVTVLQFSMAMSENQQVASYRNSITRGEIFVTEHVQESFDQAVSVDEGGSVFDTDAGVLTLNFDSGAISYEIQNGGLVSNRGGGTVALTSSEITVDQFRLEAVRNDTGTLTGIRISLQISSSKTQDESTLVTSYIL